MKNKNRMKTKIYLFLIALIFISCSGNKQQKMNEKIQDEITLNIDEIENENTEINTVLTQDSVIEDDNTSALIDESDDNINYDPTDELVEKAAATIIEMVKNRDKKGISKIINHYPFEREYPVPPVKDEKDFIERFDEIFDSKLITKIINKTPKNWEAFGWRGMGLYFTSETGNYSNYFATNLLLGFLTDSVGNPFIHLIGRSETEAKKAERIIELERKELHESLKSFLYPVVLVETPTRLVRIDRINKKDTIIGNHEWKIGYRYASWKRGSSISDKPDLILTDGIQIVGGTADVTSYLFKNDNYVYSCELGVWVSQLNIGYFTIYENAEIDENGFLNYGDFLSYEGDDSGSGIEVVYWSERSKLK